MASSDWDLVHTRDRTLSNIGYSNETRGKPLQYCIIGLPYMGLGFLASTTRVSNVLPCHVRPPHDPSHSLLDTNRVESNFDDSRLQQSSSLHSIASALSAGGSRLPRRNVRNLAKFTPQESVSFPHASKIRKAFHVQSYSTLSWKRHTATTVTGVPQPRGCSSSFAREATRNANHEPSPSQSFTNNPTIRRKHATAI